MKEDLFKALEVLKQGGIILYPTDTIWGIGCDATNEEAVEKIYAIKKREKNRSMLILVDNSAKVQNYVQDVPDIAWDLIDLTDKPLTIIFNGAKNLAPNLISTDGSIGIRVTSEDFSRELCYRFRNPIVSTSANFTGKSSPQNFNEIDPKIIEMVDYVVTYRQDEIIKQSPSSILKIGSKGDVQIIRK
ncbi:MAG: L-threonylcarbamoyladenylate synthase [Dysgonamonadaceae bacterium]|jgi:L-threonylcarbamoyladenylate synthase|nr:L-threonylcarbamoyladenylate synthase [Dysgonamonadaceae bacterium]MDD3355411.1 L-threonylcarbamoyladenylate synthase [Dysgonamonadaceae bacterium]MDD3727218.1 L-threonylcarbamoyladenylate synthase [Dysgonamonadaceae bacterium]MDD4245991.1 L-threonylcarbamoyladenylate synthase [Dysgonamonadaceae bacterium]MDD4605770.1 L-threonylcarbamoyladenylate synthase [Dysgonamonadaceae bacterium]